MKVARNIEWDLDTGEEELVCTLPESVMFNFPIEDDEISDALSNAFDFCVKNFTITLEGGGISNENHNHDRDRK